MVHRIPVSWCLALVTACAAPAALDEPPDGEHERFDAGKADGLCAAEGSPVAMGILTLANDVDVDVDELDAAVVDGGAGLNRTAAQNIVAARPIADLAALDAVPWVGLATCKSLARYACNERRDCLAPFDAVTWNLEHFPKASATQDAVVDILDELAPDVVGVQEIESPTGFAAVVDALDGYAGVLGKPGDTQVGLLYRTAALEVVTVEHLFVDDGYAFPRPVLAVTAKLRDALDATEVVIVVVHLKALSGASNEARRRAATAKLRTWIDGRRAAGHAEILVMGDWNDRIEEPQSTNVFAALLESSARLEFLTAAAAAAGEFSYVRFGSLIDHVLVTDELLDVLVDPTTEVLPLEQTFAGDYLGEVTDHRPVRSRFGVPVGY